MTEIQSKYFDNSGTSYPLSIIVLLGETAVDNSKFLGLNARDNSRTKSVKPCFSAADPLVQSVCQQTENMKT